MAKKKLTNIFFLFFILLSSIVFANPNSDQWQESDKSYKDLINEG